MLRIPILCTLMASANKSLEKKKFPSGWKCYKTIGSYVICAFIEIWSTWEVWRALKKLELLSATPRATLTHLLCSPNFPRATYLDERTLTYEPIVKFIELLLNPNLHFRNLVNHSFGYLIVKIAIYCVFYLEDYYLTCICPSWQIVV